MGNLYCIDLDKAKKKAAPKKAAPKKTAPKKAEIKNEATMITDKTCGVLFLFMFLFINFNNFLQSLNS